MLVMPSINVDCHQTCDPAEFDLGWIADAAMNFTISTTSTTTPSMNTCMISPLFDLSDMSDSNPSDRTDLPSDVTSSSEVGNGDSDSTLDDMIFSIITSIIDILLTNILPHYNKVAYHTSTLSGHQWMQELISGHPKRIQCELGVYLHVFQELIKTMRHHGQTDSKYVLLEEQLGIFLYMCVTGLSM